MKQAHNNQVDLLLRSLAKARADAISSRGSNPGEGNRATSDHLDADELNSYAEGVVPAPARLRYIEHLADCDLCRGMVVNLTQAAGIVNRSEAPEQQRGSTIWQKLATLFSPAVLRFAVPALVLTAVIGIGMLAMWQQRGQRDLVAKNEPPASAAPTVELKQSELSDNQRVFDAPAVQQKAVGSPEANEAFKREKSALDDRVNAQETETRTGTGDFAGSVAASKDAGQPTTFGNRVEPQKGYAPEPKAEPPPPVSTMTETDKAAPIPKEEAAKLDQERQRDLYKSKTTPNDEHGPNRSPAPSAGVGASNRRLDDLPAARGGPYSAKKDSKVSEKANEAETRVVSGKRFTRDGGAWVDTAYNASRSAIRVSRGSEQFRALVADEPGLREIADQLSGVVIVVWKNRAYRFQ